MLKPACPVYRQAGGRQGIGDGFCNMCPIKEFIVLMFVFLDLVSE